MVRSSSLLSRHETKWLGLNAERCGERVRFGRREANRLSSDAVRRERTGGVESGEGNGSRPDAVRRTGGVWRREAQRERVVSPRREANRFGCRAVRRTPKPQDVGGRNLPLHDDSRAQKSHSWPSPPLPTAGRGLGRPFFRVRYARKLARWYWVRIPSGTLR